MIDEKERRLGSPERWLVLSDQHYPYHHRRFIKAVKRFAADYDPHHIVINGDGLDFYDLSRFNKNPERRFKLQKDIDFLVGDFLEYWSTEFGKHGTQLHYTEGNHERRSRTYCWSQAPEHSSLRGMKVPQLLSLDRLGYKWYNLETPIEAGSLIIQHGLFARKGGGISAKAMLERYGTSSLSGHSHRMGSFFRTDWNGVHAAWEQGCMVDIKQQEYDPQPDWQCGFAVVQVWPRGYFHVDLIPLIDNKFFFHCGKAYAL